MTTRACLLTPPGRGAIATIVVTGDSAVPIVETLFDSATNRIVSAEPIGRILFGRWRSTQESPEELVICRTSDKEVEVQCHGGPAAINAILKSLENHGSEIIPWTEFVGGDDLIITEARLAISMAATECTAAILLDQLHGSLSKEISKIAAMSQTAPDQAIDRINRLLELEAVGLHLTKPWQVVIAGPPNVGKSSLINAIAGFERAIVFDQPGTTRDVVSVRAAFDGWPVELSDTAGIRDSNDFLENAGIERARQRIADADLLVDVRAANDQSRHATPLVSSETVPTITVVNKCDLADVAKYPEGCVRTVATESVGIECLIEQITHALVPAPPIANQPVPFTDRQFKLLRLAKDRFENNDKSAAERTLSECLFVPKTD